MYINPRKMKKPLVSVIVLNWNNSKDLEICLKSLSKQTYSNYEVIIVDNASTDNSIEIIKKFSKFKLIQNEKNYGFAKGNNIGIENAKGRYIITLNNDTLVDSHWIEELTKVSEEHPESGSLSCKMLFLDRPNIINSIGLKLYWDGKAVDEGFNEQDKGQYEEIKEVFGPCGGSAFFRREALEDIKLDGDYYDSDFGFYSEDLDLAFRLQLRGWNCLYVPKAKLFHKFRGTTGKIPNFGLYYGIRNKVFLIIKNYPLRLLIFYSPILVVRQIISFLYYLIKLNKRAFQSRMLIFWYLPKMLRKRWKIQRTRKVSYSRVRNLLHKRSLFNVLFK